MTGKRRVTINTIAQLAGTSKTTVSFYLNGHTQRMSAPTQERIKKAIEETGYTPSTVARSMNLKETGLVGVVINDITNNFSNQIVKGIEEVAHQQGYRILVTSSSGKVEEEKQLISRLLSVGVDGFIVQPTSQFKEISSMIEEAGKQLVFFDSKFYDFTSNWVKTDNYEATFNAVTRCIERGYERFLLIGAQPQLLSSRIERANGFIGALEAKGLSYTSLEFENDKIDTTRIASFLSREIDRITPTLVFAPNCWALADIYVTMRPYYDLMPGTVGLLGYDNEDWAGVACPSLSVIVQPAYKEGQKAFEMLLKLLHGEKRVNTHEVLDCNVIWGQSTR